MMEKHFWILVFISMVHTFAEFSEAASTVKYLPGFPGPLPFVLETGYVGVDESEDVQLFYYFTKSESDPESDPLILWLTGGPCCSAFSGLAYEIGPIMFEPFLYDGSLPKLMLNPYSWTKGASVIFLDKPVGAGFSYARNVKASQSSDLRVSHQIYEFLRKWLVEHPEFISNPIYLGGDSYGGFILPIVAQLISDGNEQEIEPKIDLKGYLVGNPVTGISKNYQVPFAHSVALISNELYEALRTNCHGEYQNIDSSNALCLQNMQTFDQLINGINKPHFLEPKGRPEAPGLSSTRRSTAETFTHKVQKPKSRSDYYRLSYYWANDESVQEALHIRKGTVDEWIRCRHNTSFALTLSTVVPYHAKLSAEGYRSLVYSGDHDMVVPHIATQAWIKSLNYQITDDWRQWIVGGQIAGYTRTYSNKMTFATVKGGGHTAPEYKPEECLAMFKRWISSKPL